MSPPRLLVIRTGDVLEPVATHHGQFADWILQSIGDAWPGPIAVLDARTGLDDDLRQSAGVILTGSPSSVTERAPWMLQLEARLVELFAADHPVLGICFGHQIIAKALGGEVERNAQGREIGTIEVALHDDDPLFAGLDRRFAVNATHVDTVTRLPPGARRLATSDREATAAYRVGSFRGVQFHPEIDGSVMRAIVQVRREVLAAEGFDVDAMHAAARDCDAGARILKNFVASLRR